MKAEEFIREVDEELQRERLAALWKRYGAYVIAAAAAIVLGVALWNGWQWWAERQRSAEARAWDTALVALQEERFDAAAEALEEFAAGASPGFATVARLQAAAAEVADGDRAAAAETLAAADADDPLLTDLAALLEIAAILDEADPNDLLRRLEPLAADDASWRLTARELMAVALVRAGQITRARELLNELAADPEAPLSLQQRAAALASALEAPEAAG